MDENENKAENQEAVADNSPAASPAEEPTTAPETEAPEVESEPASSDETREVSEEGEGVKKRSAEKRIHELVKERNSAKAQSANLSKQLSELTDRYRYNSDNLGGYPQQPSQPIAPEIQPGEELTLEEYNQRLKQAQQRGEQEGLRRADQLVQLRLAQRENLDRINREASESINKYEVLDPKSNKFDPELSDAVTKTVREIVQANPNASVKKTVERLMKPFERSVTRLQAEATETAARQVSEQASRPTPAVAQENSKDISKMSWKEIEHKTGIVG